MAECKNWAKVTQLNTHLTQLTLKPHSLPPPHSHMIKKKHTKNNNKKQDRLIDCHLNYCLVKEITATSATATFGENIWSSTRNKSIEFCSVSGCQIEM